MSDMFLQYIKRTPRMYTVYIGKQKLTTCDSNKTI
jgi:hypothetical protein